MSCPKCSRLRFEPLEDRRLLSVFAVTNTDDSGLGSFRQAILDANGASGTDTIEFDIDTGLQTISPSAPLPEITDPVIIDGSTQPGFSGTPLIEIDGSGAGSGDGLVISAGGSTVRGLVINRFSGDGIELRTAGGNTIEGNYIGTDSTGTVDLGNTGTGINVDDAADNFIGGISANAGNVISGNDLDGIFIGGTLATGNTIQGNCIGTDAAGTAGLGNGGWGGVMLAWGAAGNTVGGTDSGAGNVISAGEKSGIYIFQTGAAGNLVQGNYIGTNAAGTEAIPNAWDGITITSAPNNVIGGIVAGARNVISGNTSNGVNLSGSPSTGNTIQGNYIGTDAAGTAGLGNGGWGGVMLAWSAAGNTVGGTDSGAGNVISANEKNGIYLYETGAAGNLVQGNYIGTNAAGTEAVPNAWDGIAIASAPNNVIGGTVAGARNVVSGNLDNGIDIRNGSTGNTILGNYIGTDVTGAAALGNEDYGVHVTGNTFGTTVGGVAAGAENVISANVLGGIKIEDLSPLMAQWESGEGGNGHYYLPTLARTWAEAESLAVQLGGHLVAITSAEEQAFLASTFGQGLILVGLTDEAVEGTWVWTSGEATTYTNWASGQPNGGTDQNHVVMNVGSPGQWDDAHDTVVFSGLIELSTAPNPTDVETILGSRDTLIQGNLIGTDASGAASLGNASSGVQISNAGDILIGGTDPGAGNVISGNLGDGIRVNYGSYGNTIEGNLIGTDLTGAADLGNTGTGIYVDNVADNIIGGITEAARNVISGNDLDGIFIGGTLATGNVIQGNYIGTDVTGTLGLGRNADQGIQISGGASDNIVGGTDSGARNLISGNQSSAVEISGTDTTNNVVLGNYLGTDAGGTVGLGNGGYGTVKLGGGAAGNIIGGADPGAGNVIAASPKHGIYIARAGASGNLVQGNYVGTNAAGTAAIPSALAGIAIDHSPNNVIGGTTAGARNVVSGNTGAGIQIWGDVSTGNTIQGNYLGTDVTGTQALANNAGVWSGSSQNTIGGTAAGAGNLISGNRNQGIRLSSGAQETIVQGNYIGTDLSGTQPLGNQGEGVWLDGGANHTIGGTDPGAGNLISGNLDDGIQISGGSSGNTVLGNYIGTDVTGAAALGNDGPGIYITGNAFGNTVGGIAAGAENVISANGQEGIRVEDFSPLMAQWESGSGGNDHYYLPTLACTWSEAESLAVQLGGHLAGVTSAEEQGFLTSTFGESLIWIGLTDEAVEGTWVWSSGEPVTYTNWAGGQPSGNTGQDYAQMNWGGTGLWDDYGPAMIPGLIELVAAPNPSVVETILGSRNTLIQGNLIGTDASGAAALGNASSGVQISNAGDILVGGTDPGTGNVISGNDSGGVYISGSLASGNVIQGNYIGTNAAGTLGLGNSDNGIRIAWGASDNTIGGTSSGARNVISGNFYDGIDIYSSFDNTILGNFIGTDVTGAAPLGNNDNGVHISGNAFGNTDRGSCGR